MPAPQKIHELVDQFQRNREDYRAAVYNETQARREFIDPFFKALGWDIDNEQGYAEAYKEVIHETAVKVKGKTKAPDYAFRIGGQPKFFVEAKKPSVNIKDDVHPAFQLRSYAWSGKLPLSILTDFEEFAVYDCRPRPVKSDKAANSRVMYFTYDQYIEKWDQIAAIFSPEAIRRGSFDKYVQSNKLKQGTAEVDDAFLADISSWRELLARNIALRNKLKPRELNFAVQRIIDRIIFLRIAEDRGIEPYGRLRDAAKVTPVYAELCRLFQLADQKYNSGLFHFQPEKGREGEDSWTLGLHIDDKPLQTILKNLYYPDSPFQFDMIPADILGQVYEQFLGKVIRLTAGGQAKIEDKPEVKKAGGVFYTPTYIVDYIVAQTVGKLLEGRKPGPKGDASKLTILDPACGSGSFLLGAYQYLLDWHLTQYKQNPEQWAKGKTPAIFDNGKGWRLTIDERKRILLNNIYGVDIDMQAVEVTKLSLLLKVLEGETEAVAQQKLLADRVLPDLDSNIKCGNSLIGPDFYDGQMSLGLLDEEEMYRVNVFDWAAAFPRIVPWGGFDAVIGNPPYIRIQAMKQWAPKEVEFYKQAYKAASKGSYDIYVVFIEKGLELLNRNGILGFILPHKFFQAKYGEPIRQIIASDKKLSQIIHFGHQQIFANATTYTCLLFLSNAKNDEFEYAKVDDLAGWRQKGEAVRGYISTTEVSVLEWNFTVGDGARLFKRLTKMPTKLGNVANKIYQGLITSADTVYLFKDYRETANPSLIEVYSQKSESWVLIEAAILKSVIRSGKIHRYQAYPSVYVLFPYKISDGSAQLYTEREIQDIFPKAWEYLNQHKLMLENRENGKFKDAQWYRFGRTQNLGYWE